MKKGEKIAIYSRKSKFTGKGESIGNQAEMCREHIRSHYGEDALENCVVFEDEGFSGGDMRRPDFQKMMARIRKGEFRMLVVYRLDRISRNIGDFTGMVDELNRLGVSFVSIREQFDTTTPMGRAMMYIISVFSQLERETIAERIRDNMHELAKTGRWLGGNTPTGYASESISNVTVDGRVRKSCKLKLNPEEAELVKTIFDLYLQENSLSAVETELLRRRLKTKTGKDFNRFSIKAILQNPVYMMADREAYQYFNEHGVFLFSDREAFNAQYGMMVYNRTDQEKGKATILLPMTDWIVAVGKHSGIITGKQWVEVQQGLERNKDKAFRRPRTNEALLTGLIYCSCGARMHPKLTKRTTEEGALAYSYVCTMKEHSKRERCASCNVGGNALDKELLDRLKELTEDDSAFLRQLRGSRQRYMGNLDLQENQLSQLREELAENEKKIAGLVDSMSLLEGSKAMVYISKRIEELSEENQRIEERIKELEGLASENAMQEQEVERLCRQLRVFRYHVDKMTLEEKRAAVRAVVRRVVWDGVNVHVVLFGAEGEIEFPELLGKGNEGEEGILPPSGEGRK